MKFVVFVCLVAVAAAQQGDRDAVILSDERNDQGDGNFNYAYETSNGIYQQKSGAPGSEGQSNMIGVFRFQLADGSFAEVNYVADEFGYKPSSDLLPVGPPAPAHVAELLAIAEEQRRQGITFERK